MQNNLRAFISYASEDEPLLKELENHLALLRNQGIITMWHDHNITAGRERESEIDTHLKTARIVLLLISANFLASPYCYSRQMRQAMERHHANEVCVIPILLRPADWKGAPFEKLELLPRNRKPITTWRNRDAAFAEIVSEIRKAVENLNPHSIHSTSSSQSPVWNVPHRRNPFFTGREELFTLLHERLQLNRKAALAQAQAMSGLGGIGKTQTAVEYAYRYRDHYHHVLWVRADTHEMLLSDYLMIAKLLNLPEQERMLGSQQEIREIKEWQSVIDAVKRWFEQTSNWLLILDNADTIERVHNFLPMGGGGCILLTTRSQAVGSIAERLEIGQMEQLDGVLFLLRRAKLLPLHAPLKQAREQDQRQAETIMMELGGLPLALDQAGAYLEETGCGLSDYLDLYRIHWRSLLNRRGRTSIDHPESVTTTLLLSFRQVKQINPIAADLLCLCAFLDPDNIPEMFIITGASELGPLLNRVANDPFQFNEAIEELRKFSLIQRNPETKILSIHRLVQVVLKDSMNSSTQNEWEKRVQQAIDIAFPALYTKENANHIFELVFQYYNVPLRNYVKNLISHGPANEGQIADLLTEDICQEVFVRVWNGWRTFPPNTTFHLKAYLYKVAQNIYRDYIRRSKPPRHMTLEENGQ